MKINKARKTNILAAIKGLCTPAGGCTEIGAIGYCVAAAAQQVNGDIEKVQHIVVKVSPYIFKNVMHVGVPNLGTCGITMIAAAAAAIKDPTDKLELYKNVTSNVKAIARRLIDNRIVSILIAKDSDPVYVKTKIISKDRKIEALVQTNHDNLAYVKVNGDVIYGSKQSRKNKNKTRRKVSIENISIEHLFDIVNCFKKEELHFLEKLFKMNWTVSEYGKNNLVPRSFTECYVKNLNKQKYTLEEKLIIDLSAAIDARMNGADLPVMTSCGSGDHGLTASIPQFTYYKTMKSNKETFLRSLLLVNLIVWKVKSSIGNLSCMCGSVIAASTAAICGLAYQKGVPPSKICGLMEDLLYTYNSCICDGAKLACTHKILTSFRSGLLLLDMVDANYKIKKQDGIASGNVNLTLKIFKKMSKENSNKFNLSVVDGMCRYGVEIE